jgi:hypothetical protein
VTCHETFTGHKRRVTCHVCADAVNAENAHREGLLAKAGLSAADWTLMRVAEMNRMHAQYADLLLELHVERKVRRELAAAFTRLAKCHSAGTNAHYALRDGREVVEKSEQMDEEIAKRSAARNAPAPAAATP